jgi:type IV pilus assembly protein PilA
MKILIQSKQYNNGFTLIELLTVVVIIGILAVIAIPQFAEYRTRGFDAKALSDLRNAATGEEAYFSLYEHYVDCIGTCGATLPGVEISTGVVVDMFQVPAVAPAQEYFTGRSYHPGANHATVATAWTWNSSLGGLQ